METIQLVKLAKKGNKEALLQLVFSQKENYFRLAMTYLKNEEDAMDALEDMIIKLYDTIHQLRKNENFYSWSKTILVNSCKQKLKTDSKFVYLDKDERQTEGHENQQIESLYIHQLLSNLNESQQEAIRLKYFLDLDLQTIATITNTSVGTVKSRIHNGLQKLKEIVGRDQPNGY